VRAGTVAQAVQFGEVVAIAIPLPAVLDLPAAPFTGRNGWPSRSPATTLTPSARSSTSSTSSGSPRWTPGPWPRAGASSQARPCTGRSPRRGPPARRWPQPP